MFNVRVYAAEIFDNHVDSIDEGFTVVSQPSGQSEVNINDGNLELYFDTTQDSAKGRADIITPCYEGTKDSFIISFSAKSTINSDKTAKIMYMLDSGTANTVELCRFSGNTVKFFDSDTEIAFTEEIELKIVYIIDPDTEKAKVYVNNSCVFNDTVPNWKSNIDFSSIRFRFRNYSTAAVAELSRWNINELTCNLCSNNSLVVKPENATVLSENETVELSLFNKVFMHPDMKDCNNYLLLDGERSILFDCEFSDNKIDIIPKETLEASSSYQIKILNVYDEWGNVIEENKISEFKIVASDYSFPEICFSEQPEEINIVDGQTVTFNVKCIQGTIETVIFVFDDEIISTVNSDPYNLTFSPGEGEHELYAYCIDSIGAKAYTQKTVIKVANNDLPDISVEGLNNNANIEYGDSIVLSIDAVDNDGIEKYELFLNGLKIKEESNSFVYTLENLAVGNHVIKVCVYDVLGASSIKTIKFKIQKTIDSIHYENNFNSYTGNNQPPSGTTGASQRGYLAGRVLRDDFGISCLIGMDTVNESFKEGNSAWIGINAGGITEKAKIEFDMLVSARTDSYKFYYRQSNVSTVMFAEFCTEGIKSNGNIESDYETEKWYHCSMIFDPISHLISFSMDDKEIITAPVSEQITQLDQLRFFGPNYDDVKSYMAIDNFIIRTLSEAPIIENIQGETMVENLVHFDSSYLKLTLSKKIYTEKFKKEMVEIKNHYGESVEIASVEVNENDVYIYLNEKLESNLEYTVTIKEDTYLTESLMLGADIYGTFTSSFQNFECTDAYLVKTGRNKGLYFSIFNNTGQTKDIYVIMHKYKDNRICDGRVVKVSAESLNYVQEHKIDHMEVSSGESIKLYFTNQLSDLKLLCNKLYVLN